MWEDWKVLGVISTIIMGFVFLTVIDEEQVNNIHHRAATWTTSFIVLGVFCFGFSLVWFKDLDRHIGLIAAGTFCYLIADVFRCFDLRQEFSRLSPKGARTKDDWERLREIPGDIREARLTLVALDIPVFTFTLILLLVYFSAINHQNVGSIMKEPEHLKIFIAGMLSAVMITYNLFYIFLQWRIYERPRYRRISSQHAAEGAKT